MASLSGDKRMMEEFDQNRDIHLATASHIFDIPPDLVDAEMRRKAKGVNFGIIYGISAFGLSVNLGIARNYAQDIISRYLKTYPGVQDFMGSTIEYARQNGFVETMMRRRRYLRNVNSRNHTMRSADERVAINSPVQGSAAEMIKIAMIRIQDWMRKERLRSRMILQVHDELVFEVHREEIRTMEKNITDLMRNALPLKVPVVVTTGVGASWLEAHR